MAYKFIYHPIKMITKSKFKTSIPGWTNIGLVHKSISTHGTPYTNNTDQCQPKRKRERREEEKRKMIGEEEWKEEK